MKTLRKIFSSEDHTCPWWLCFTFDNPIRGILQNPFKILDGFVKPGYSVLDIGPGMGYFTFPLSQIAGEKGKVVALDIQEPMLRRLEKKAVKKNIKNIQIKLYDGTSFDIKEKFDFVLLFWMYHEVRNKPVFINELKSVIKPGTDILIAEPLVHVSSKKFSSSVKLLTDAGFVITSEPHIPMSRAVVLRKKSAE